MNVAKDLEPLLFPVEDLYELPGNPRRGDVDAVKRSYEAFGQRKPIVARRDDDGRAVVVAGNHQLKAVRELGWDRVAVVWADDLTEDEARGFALADNRVADLGTYDNEALAALIAQVQESPGGLEGTGYDETDAVALLHELAVDEPSFGNLSPDIQTITERGAELEAAGIRSIIVPFGLDDYNYVVGRLAELRKEYDVETNADVVLALLRG